MDSFPEQIDRYRILEEVGRGGMAVVYRGLDQSLQRQVAIKILHPHLSGDAESRNRFQREARAVARLRHPNIIEIYDFADGGEGPSYIVTEFIEGLTLKAFLEQQGTWFPEVAALIAVQICEAIGHAHSLGIIHRDLKPENIMINRDGTLKLMDFGIAKVIDQQQQMTLTGTLLGSPAHMAPELLEGKELDVRSDLFSVGTILYWMATGKLPFTGKNPHHVLRNILEGNYPDPQQANPLVGADLARVIRRALAHDPQERFGSAAAMQSALNADLAGLELGEVATELKIFFGQPQEYVQALRPKVSRHLLARSRSAIGLGRHREALESLDRLLALEPDHAEALDLLRRLQRRRRWRRLARGAALVLLAALFLGTGLWAAVRFWPAPDEGPDGGTQPPAPDAGPVAVIAPQMPDAGRPSGLPDAGGPIAGAPVADGGRTRGGDRRGAVAIRPPRPPEPPVEHPVSIKVDPFFDRMSIDGQPVARRDRSTRYGQLYNTRLAAGSHRVLIQNQACLDDEFVLQVPREPRSAEDLEHRRKLRFRPATLVVDSELPDAALWVDGIFKGTAGESKAKPITVPVEGDSGSLQVQLRIEHPGAGRLLARVRLAAGQQQVFRAERAAFTPGVARDGGGP